MKKLITIFCIACMSAGVIAQPGVRIGSYVVHVQKANADSLTNVFAEEDPCPPCPSENETRPISPKNKYRNTTNCTFAGIGFILPDNGSNYYTTLGGNSINIDIGGMRLYHLSRHFSLGGTVQYSFYNYKFRDAVDEEDFNAVVLRSKTFSNDDLLKQVYRSHNAAVGLFTRLYLSPQNRNYNRGLYVDLGVQGDFAASRYCMLKTQSEKKKRYREDYAFNPFSASATVRIGWDKFLPGRSAIFARYRFTNAFNKKSLPMDLPPMTIGIQFF